MASTKRTVLLGLFVGMSPTGHQQYSFGHNHVNVSDDAVIGDYDELKKNHQHHQDLWDWCIRNGHTPPSEFKPV